jgi:hypothetical protein
MVILGIKIVFFNKKAVEKRKKIVHIVHYNKCLIILNKDDYSQTISMFYRTGIFVFIKKTPIFELKFLYQ